MFDGKMFYLPLQCLLVLLEQLGIILQKKTCQVSFIGKHFNICVDFAFCVCLCHIL